MKTLALMLTSTLVCGPLASWADDISKVNGSIRVDAGQTVDDVSTVNGSIHIEERVQAGDVETVNGSIDIGAGAAVGHVDTVNGRVSFREGARAGAVESVNGALHLATRSQVAGAVSTVNGAVRLEKDVNVEGKVTNVNGKITLEHAQVSGGLETTHGDIEVGAGSGVRGGIHVDKPNVNWLSRKSRAPRIIIGPGAVVEGALKFEREVELYVSESAKIGPVEGAKAIMFKGEAPAREEQRQAEMPLER